MRRGGSTTLFLAILIASIPPPRGAHAQREMATVETLEMVYNTEDLLRFVPAGPGGPHLFLSIVPDQYSTIQAAVDAAPRSGGTILVRSGTYAESVIIDANRFDDLTIEGECGTRPLIAPSSGHGFRVDNQSDRQVTVKIRNFHIDDVASGISVNNSNSDVDAITTTLYASRLLVTDSSHGIQAGNATGTHHCNGNWGAIREEYLDQPITAVYVSNCAFLGGSSDGMNLWRATGAIVSNIIAQHSDEGVHSTDLHDAIVSNNLIMGHYDNQFHLQHAGDVKFKNNVILAGPDDHWGYYADGVAVAGNRDPHNPTRSEVRIGNNIFYGCGGAGVRVGGVTIREPGSPCEEYNLPSKTWVKGNVFLSNADGGQRYAIHFQDPTHNVLTNWADYNLFYENNGRDFGPDTLFLGSNNLFATDPLFSALPKWNGLLNMTEPEQMRGVLMGFRPHLVSPLIDAGAVDPIVNDQSYLAEGTVRNDIGLFGGPSAVPGPNFIGPRPTPCLPVCAVWSRNTVYFDDPLYLEPGGDPLGASTEAEILGQQVNLHWVQERIEMDWVNETDLLSYHELGNQALEVHTVGP